MKSLAAEELEKSKKAAVIANVKRNELLAAEIKKSDYEFTTRAFRMSKDKSKISFEVLVGENCEAQKIFTVYRNKKTKIQLSCGVILTAYYGFESKEEN